MHVLTPAVMRLLADEIAAAEAAGGASPVMLTPALAALARRERYLALELDGARFNIGVKYGMLMAQLALALSGGEREEILAKLLELIAGRLSGAT
jgi:UTP--glucose-1-phosphate uridylyltransferase